MAEDSPFKLGRSLAFAQVLNLSPPEHEDDATMQLLTYITRISRSHASLVCIRSCQGSHGSTFVVDHSMNGTFVNNEPVKKSRRLRNGDVVSILRRGQDSLGIGYRFYSGICCCFHTPDSTIQTGVPALLSPRTAPAFFVASSSERETLISKLKE
eukprot:Rmarinus@m.12018